MPCQHRWVYKRSIFHVLFQAAKYENVLPSVPFTHCITTNDLLVSIMEVMLYLKQTHLIDRILNTSSTS